MIIRGCAAAERPDANYHAGAWCEYCEAKATCQEFQKLAFHILPKSYATWGLVPPDQKLKLWQSAQMAKKLCKEIDAKVAEDLNANKMAIPGITKGPDFCVRDVDSALAVYQLFAECLPMWTRGGAGFTESELQNLFWQHCSIGVGAIEAMYRHFTGADEAAATAWVNEHCRDFIINQPRSGRIKVERE